jgi:hypothetical protein
MMKIFLKSICFLSVYFCINTAKAQQLKVTSGSDLTIKTGTLFYISGLSLTPSADYTLSNTTLTHATAPTVVPTNSNINRVYQFSGITAPFTGSVQINYQDAELNGITEPSLVLNTYNGTAWEAFTTNNTRDGVNNTIITTSLSSIAINELTLSNGNVVLPLIWQSFTVSKQNNSAVLMWTTAQERNTKTFIVQQSVDGIKWDDLNSLPASGTKNSPSFYSYTHKKPNNGVNYYRILQLDSDGKYTYSDIRSANFSIEEAPFIVLGNLITNGNVAIQVNVPTGISLFSMDGKLLFKKRLNVGLQNIDVSTYAKATYLLKTEGTFQKLVIQ